MARVTFLTQREPIDEYGRALYAVARSILRAHLDQLGTDDLTDLNRDRDEVTLRQLSKFARLERDKGMLGDGFEWAVHEAIVGREPGVLDLVAEGLKRTSKALKSGEPTSLLFGHERARYLGFLDAVVENAGREAVLLPDGQGHPFAFGPWVTVAAKGKAAELELGDRIQQVWKTDIFLSNDESLRYAAATVKSQWRQLEGGRGLRVAIVPEAKDLKPGVSRHAKLGLWMVALPDPNGFMGLFNDAYKGVGQAICTLGKHERPAYFLRPSAKAQKLQAQLEKYGTVKVFEVIEALNEAAQQDLVGVSNRLLSVEAPPWLYMKEKRPTLVAPKPSFERLD